MLVFPGTLSYKRHLLASERFVTQHVCEASISEVRLGAAGQIRIASGEISRGAVGHTTASKKVNG